MSLVLTCCCALDTGTLLLCCCHSPSGYTQDANQNTPCTPLTTPVVVQLFMRATSPEGCTTDLINSVRDALIDFLKDPNSAYGECRCAVASSSVLHRCVWYKTTATGRSTCAGSALQAAGITTSQMLSPSVFDD